MIHPSGHTVPRLAGLAAVSFVVAAVIPQVATGSHVSAASGFFAGLGAGACVLIVRILWRRRRDQR